LSKKNKSMKYEPDDINQTETVFTPNIFLNKSENFFLISGKSVTENAEEFYEPVFNWFNEYFKNPNISTEIIFFIEYLNSASLLQIGSLIDILIKNKNNTNLIVDWLYEKDDELSIEIGKEFQYIYKYKFNFIEVEEKDTEIFIF